MEAHIILGPSKCNGGEKYIAMIDYPAYIPQYLKKQSYLVNFPVFIVDYWAQYSASLHQDSLSPLLYVSYLQAIIQTCVYCVTHFVILTGV